MTNTTQATEKEVASKPNRQAGLIFWQILKAAVMACVVIPNIPLSFSILASPNLDSASKVGSLVGILLFLFIATSLLYGRQIFRAKRER